MSGCYFSRKYTSHESDWEDTKVMVLTLLKFENLKSCFELMRNTTYTQKLNLLFLFFVAQQKAN
jgi:hypothetical protein